MCRQSPSVFIGSSAEGLVIARNVELQLAPHAQTTLWPNGIFPLGSSALEALMNALDQYDFVVLILTPDDLTESRSQSYASPRDNIIFELGLFMGRLGRSRVFAVHEASADLKLPSDLSGITTATYRGRPDDVAAAVSPACTQIINAIQKTGAVDRPSLRARFWRRRSEFSIQEWRDLFASAKTRIWLLGHSMEPSVNPEGSGHQLAKGLAEGVDIRLVVLDPFSTSSSQIDEIEHGIAELSLRDKIVWKTLHFAKIVENRAKVIHETRALQGLRAHMRAFSVGLTEEIIYNSIVIVDDRFIITIYSHLYEMGDGGVTMDLDRAQRAEETLCRFFEDEFSRIWRRSRAIADYRHQPLPVEWRIYGYKDKVQGITAWLGGSEHTLPPPHLAVIYPTYRCIYGARSKHGAASAEIPDGPYSKKVLCPNCMFGPVLNNTGMPDMPVGRLSELFDALIEGGVRQIEIAGGGEPLHHPEAPELVNVVHSKRMTGAHNVTFGLLSNVTALAGCDYADDLIGAFDYIRWSWPEDAELSRDMTRVYLEALAAFVGRKKSLQNGSAAHGVRVGVKVLATANNVQRYGDGLMKLARQLGDIGIDHIKIRPIRSKTTSADEIELRHAEDALLRLGLELARKGKDILEVDLRQRNVKRAYKCQLSSLITVVEPNGDLRMCWNDVTSKDRVIGNVFQGGFDDVWGGTKHRDVCVGTDADWVCNAESGCHCRIVGYQDAAEKLISAQAMAAPALSGRITDCFI